MLKNFSYILKLENLILKVMELVNPKSFDIQLTEEINALVHDFKELTIEEQEQIRNKITPEISGYLVLFSNKLSVHAINSNDQSFLTSAILCHVIENFTLDPRENMRSLSILNFACEELNIPCTDLVDSIVRHSSQGALNSINEFCTRKKVDKSLKTMGLRVVKKDNSTDLEQIPPAWMLR